MHVLCINSQTPSILKNTFEYTYQFTPWNCPNLDIQHIKSFQYCAENSVFVLYTHCTGMDSTGCSFELYKTLYSNGQELTFSFFFMHSILREEGYLAYRNSLQNNYLIIMVKRKVTSWPGSRGVG